MRLPHISWLAPLTHWPAGSNASALSQGNFIIMHWVHAPVANYTDALTPKGVSILTMCWHVVPPGSRPHGSSLRGTSVEGAPPPPLPAPPLLSMMRLYT